MGTLKDFFLVEIKIIRWYQSGGAGKGRSHDDYSENAKGGEGKVDIAFGVHRRKFF